MILKRVQQLITLTAGVLWQSYREWVADSAPRLSAALAYYTALSLAPMSIVIVMVATWLFGDTAVSAELLELLETAVGPEIMVFFRSLLATAERTGTGYLAGGIGLFAVLYGASRGLMCLREALNKIFGYEAVPESHHFLRVLSGKLLTIGITMLILLAILLLLFLSPFIGAVQQGITAMFPMLETLRSLRSLELLTAHGSTFLIATLFFMVIYHVLPAHRLRWRDVLPGSLFTALLFKAGDSVIRLYLRRSFVTSLFGAAGSFVIVLLWLYFLAQIIFFGAEFTFVYLTRLGRMKPRRTTTDEKENKRKTRRRLRRAQAKRARIRLRAGSRWQGSVYPAGQPGLSDGRRHGDRRDRSRSQRQKQEPGRQDR